jgi:hypothetical protein
MSTPGSGPAGGSPDRSITEPVAAGVVDAIVTAYYARVVGHPDELRRRAQNAFTITGFLATGLVGLGAVTSLLTAPLLVKVVGLAAVSCWTGSAIAFARAVASDETLTSRSTASGANDFSQEVINSVKEERTILINRRRLGQALGVVAALLTLSTLALTLFTSGPPRQDAVIYLSSVPTGQLATDPCTGGRSRLVGQVDTSSLEKQFLLLHVEGTGCGKTLALSRSIIRTVVLNPD